MMKMIQSVGSATAMEESNKTPFYGPTEHALTQRLIEITEALLPLLAKIHQNPDASSAVSSSRKLNNPLRNPIRSTAQWKAFKDSENPLRIPVKDIQELKALKEVSM